MTNNQLTPTADIDRMADTIPSDFLTVPEVADRLGIHKSVLYGWLSRRVIAFHRVGRLIRVREADVASYILHNRVEAQPLPQYGSHP